MNKIYYFSNKKIFRVLDIIKNMIHMFLILIFINNLIINIFMSKLM